MTLILKYTFWFAFLNPGKKPNKWRKHFNVQ